MARRGGNPELTKYKFKPKGSESLTAKLSMRVSPSMLQAIKQQEKWQDFVRAAIAKALESTKEAQNG